MIPTQAMKVSTPLVLLAGAVIVLVVALQPFSSNRITVVDSPVMDRGEMRTELFPDLAEESRKQVGDPITLIVRDSEGPVFGAIVQTVSEDGTKQEITTPENGEVVFTQPQTVILFISAPGYQTVAGVVSLDRDREITLQPMGILELVFEDTSGKTYPDIGVELLLPERTSLFLQDSLREVFEGTQNIHNVSMLFPFKGNLSTLLPPIQVLTGEDGTARWEGLCPGEGYRYRLPSPGAATITPPHETPPLAWNLDGHPVSTHAPRGVSGTFTVSEGTTRLVVPMDPPAALTGTVLDDADKLVASARVRIRASETHYSPNGERAVLYFQERYVITNEAGIFIATNLKPGKKQLEIDFSEERGEEFHISFIYHEVVLGDGESLDLGELAPVGKSVRGVIGFSDSRSAELPIEHVLTPEGMNTLMEVDIGALPYQGSPIPEGFHLNGSFRVLPGQHFIMHGLLWSYYKLSVDVTDLPEPRDPYNYVKRTILPFDIREEVSVLCSIPVNKTVQVHLVAGIPAGFQKGQVRGWIVGKALGKKELRIKNFTTGSGTLDATVDLPPGTFTLYVSQPQRYDRDDAGWFCKKDFTVESEDKQEVGFQLEHGVQVSGILVDPEGVPVVNRNIWFTLRELDGLGVWLFPTKTNDDGEFFVGGIPPGTTIICKQSSAFTATVGASGLSSLHVQRD